MEQHVASVHTEAVFELGTRAAGVVAAWHQAFPAELFWQRRSQECHRCDREHAQHDEPALAAWSGCGAQHERRKGDDDGRLDTGSMERDLLLPQDARGGNPPDAVEDHHRARETDEQPL